MIRGNHKNKIIKLINNKMPTKQIKHNTIIKKVKKIFNNNKENLMNGKLNKFNREIKRSQIWRIEVNFKISHQNQVSIKRVVKMINKQAKH